MARGWLDGREEELLGLVRTHGPDLARLARLMGTTPDALETAKRRRPGLRGAWRAAVEAHRRTAVESGGARVNGDTVDSGISHRILTLDELLEVAKVDRAAWEVERYKVNKWEVGAKHPVTGEIIIAPLFQVSATLARPGTAAMLEQLRAAVVRDVRQDAARRQRPRPVALPAARLTGRHLLEVCLMDLHIGKLAWGEETGSDYDSRIAEEAARAAVAELLIQASIYEVERILLPLGNDYFHFDSTGGLTTAGTPQDRDTRLHKMFRRGRGLASWMIDECAKVAPVDVVIVPGNHDELLSWMLGEVLVAEFARDARVTVDNSPRLRKYVQYGANLIGFTHGKDEPRAKLPLIMAQEVPQMWAATMYREIHTGHFHTSKVQDTTPVDSHNGVRVRVLQSLSGTDAWHYRKGYIGERRTAEGFVWRHAGGLRANLFTSPEGAAA